MNNFSRSLVFVLLATASSALAATIPVANTPPPAPTAPPPAKAPAPAPPASILDNYINELATTLKLTDDEKKQIMGYYTADGDQLKKILNDDSLSPLQQAAQVSGLRDERNAKIEKLLQDVDQEHAFPMIEAKYRVALTEFAANGGFMSPAPPPTAPSPAPAPVGPSVAK